LKIQLIRKEKGLTQTDLARLCETTQQQIAKIEGGFVDPKLSTLRKVAESLEVDISKLFYSRPEFLKLLNDLIKEEGLNKGRIAIASLNGLASELKRIPKFHPFWEKIELKKNRAVFMEEKNV
jgi:transcriptional regulator with XRE-family HTH domain